MWVYFQFPSDGTDRVKLKSVLTTGIPVWRVRPMTLAMKHGPVHIVPVLALMYKLVLYCSDLFCEAGGAADRGALQLRTLDHL